MLKTKIVCTLGPASNSPEMIEKMMLTGMNVARLNFSHGTHEEHKKVIDRIKEARERLGIPVSYTHLGAEVVERVVNRGDA